MGVIADELYEKQGGSQRRPSQQASGPSSTITDVASRLKILEQRYNNLSRREQLTEKGMLDFERDLNSELKALQERVTQTRRHVSEVRERLETLRGQVSNSADKHDLRVLEAYLNILQPLDFLTRTEAKRLLDGKAVER